MATVKWHERSISLFVGLQTVQGTPVDPVATDVVAAIEAKSIITKTTEAFQYVGDILDRDELTTVTDTMAEVTFEAMMPMLGTIDVGLAVDDAPLSKFFQACGGFVTVDGAGLVTVDNVTDSPDYVTLDYHKSSPDATGGDAKRYRATDCRGTLDLSIASGSRTKLNFKFLGNDAPIAMVTTLTPDYGTQKTTVAPLVRLSTMQSIVLTRLSDSAPFPVCIESIDAPNFFGFDYERYQLTCQEDFTKVAAPTDVTLTFLEDETGGTDFDPEINLEEFFSFSMKYGTGAGKYVTISYDNLQLADVTDSSISGYTGKVAKFRNIGKSTILFE